MNPKSKAIMSIDNKYTCWKKTNPYNKICIEYSIEEALKDTIDREMEGMNQPSR